MKKFFLYAAALLGLVACNNKDNALNGEAPQGTPFVAGQKVTIGVSNGIKSSKAPGRMMSVTDSGEPIVFKWEEGDQILVKVGADTAHFTLSSGAGTTEAEFTGTMPAGGSTFDMQFPIKTPDLSSQCWDDSKDVLPLIAKDQMLFTASGCTLDAAANMSPQYAIMQLNLYGNLNVTHIICQIGSSSYVFHFLVDDGISLPSEAEDAKPFYFILRPSEYQTLTITLHNSTFDSKELSTYAELVAGECLNMPAAEFSKSESHTIHFTFDSGSLMTSVKNKFLDVFGEQECEEGTTFFNYLNGYYGDYNPTDNEYYISLESKGGSATTTIYLPCDPSAAIGHGETYTWQKDKP